MIEKDKFSSIGALQNVGISHCLSVLDKYHLMNGSQLLRRTIALLAALFFLSACHRPPASFVASDITGATFGRHLALSDHDGRPRALEDYRGRAVVLFFGYTSCPDVCPTALTRFAEVMKLLDSEAASVQVLFVTLDPARDTPEKLKAYVPWFHPGFVGLYGDQAAVDAAAREFKVHHARQEVGGGLGYVLDHSAGAYVFDPAGRLRLYVRDSQTPAEIGADLRLLLAGR